MKKTNEKIQMDTNIIQNVNKLEYRCRENKPNYI